MTPLVYGCQFLKPFAERQCLKKVVMMPERVLERTHCFAMMEPFLPRLLRRSGLIVHKAGDEIDYHGLRRPYYWETREMVSGMVDELHEFYNHIRDSFERGQPVSAAFNQDTNGQPDVRIAPDSIA